MSVSCCLQSLGRGEGGGSPLGEEQAPLAILDNNNTTDKTLEGALTIGARGGGGVIWGDMGRM